MAEGIAPCHLDLWRNKLKIGEISADTFDVKAEKEIIQLDNHDFSPAGDGSGVLTLKKTGQRFQLSQLQASYFQALANNSSIESVVDFYLKQGWLVSFRELYNVVKFMNDHGLILNPTLKSYFTSTEPKEAGVFDRVWNSLTGSGATAEQKTVKSYSDLPFFRSLQPELAKYLLQKTEVLKVPSHIRMIQTGGKDRDLFIVQRGRVGVYKTLPDHRRQLVAQLGEGALFGERGFLLNQPRTADIVTLDPSEILRVKHLPEFDQHIKSDKAQSLQNRFIALQALNSSTFFKDMPSDTLDSLIFQGRMVEAPANQMLFHEGQPGNTAYIILQGSVGISKNGKFINQMNQGCFGEIALMMNGGIRSASVQTTTNSIFLELNQQSFYKILAQNLILAKEVEVVAASRLQADAARK